MDNMQSNPAASGTSPSGAPMGTSMGSMPQGGEKSSGMGPLIGSIIILIILIAGGFYLWNKEVAEDEMMMEDGTMMVEDMMMEEDAQTEALESQSTSDETGAIEADLEATNMNELDAELETL